MDVIGDVKCYHCGHVSGQVEGTRTDRLVLRAFKPRPGYQGPVPGPGQRIRCERCAGPVFLEDLQPVPTPFEPVSLPAQRAKKRVPRKAA
jgi:hypothetical protein